MFHFRFSLKRLGFSNIITLAIVMTASVTWILIYYGGGLGDDKILLAGIGVIAGIGLFIYGFNRLKARRRIQAIPTSKVRSMALGTVEISGYTVPMKPLFDPIFSQPCVYYSIQAYEERGMGRHRTWHSIYDKNTDVYPFYLQDDTGRVLILPHGGEVIGGQKISRRTYGLWSGSSLEDPAARFLKVHGTTSMRSKKLYATIIRESVPLHILGFGRNIPHEMMDNGISQSQAARKLKADPEAMKNLDTNKDGNIDSMEWDLGVLQYKKKIDAEKAAHEKKENPQHVDVFTPPVVIGEAESKFFLIGDTEKQIIDHMGRAAIITLLGGPILAAVSGAYLAQHFSTK